MIRRVAISLLAIGLLVPTLAATTGGASAATTEEDVSQRGYQAFDVWLRGSKVRVNSGRCRYLPFTVRHNGGRLDRFSAEAEVWRGSKYVGETFDYQYDSRGPLRASYFWCPYEGLGTFRVGPTHVEWDDDGWGTSGQFRDGSRAHIKVKQHQRCRVDWATKKRGRVNARGTFRFYAVTASRWVNAPRGAKVTLQRQTNRGWKSLGTSRVGKQGKVHVSGPAIRRKSRYRMMQFGTPRTWSCAAQFRR